MQNYAATADQGGKADTALQSVKVLGKELTKSVNEITVAEAKTALGWDDKLDANGWATSADGVLGITKEDRSVEIQPGSMYIHKGGGVDITLDDGISLYSEAYEAHTIYDLRGISYLSNIYDEENTKF